MVLSVRYAWRLLRFGAHIVAGVLTCALVFPFCGAATRLRCVQRWSRRVLTICAVRCDSAGTDRPAGMIVANHVSWLDVFVINAWHPCRFVAKSEVRRWPVIGWLAARAGTLFIRRGRGRDLGLVLQSVVDHLVRGERVAYFPEGTSSPHGALLPFHPALFEAARVANVPILPCALRYLDEHGAAHRGPEYVGGMSFGQSVARILSGRAIVVRLECLAPILPLALHRRELAQAAHTAVAGALRRSELVCSNAQTLTS